MDNMEQLYTQSNTKLDSITVNYEELSERVSEVNSRVELVSRHVKNTVGQQISDINLTIQAHRYVPFMLQINLISAKSCLLNPS